MPIERKPANPVPKSQVPANSVPHRVRDGESWQTLADRYGVDAAAIIRANFNTTNPDEVNWYLRHYVGCNKPTRDGKNWTFSTSASPGIVHIPPKHLVFPPEEVVVVVPDRLEFDGSKLTWFRGGKVYKSWSAVSGRSGYQTKKFQTLADKGPVPEGKWHVRQSDYQAMGSRAWYEELAAEVGRTGWPGGESSWGKHRIWLHPVNGTNTFGRSGFSIHGGDTPGSAGCIDMTSSLDDFIREFRSHGKDLELTVKYTN